MKTIKYVVPIYGIKMLESSPIEIESNVILRNTKLLEREDKVFEKLHLRSDYRVVIQIYYTFDESDASEPYPGISLKLLNIIDASLVVYGEGQVGLAAIIPDDTSTGVILSYANPHFQEYLDKKIDGQFVEYYAKFKKAYNMRPMAFDIFRRSQERISNNDRTIDSCTILESILVPKGERSKKSFILNGLKIMGYGTHEIGRIEKLVDYRNAIIHADREKLLSLLTGAAYTFKLVRAILYKFVESPWD